MKLTDDQKSKILLNATQMALAESTKPQRSTIESNTREILYAMDFLDKYHCKVIRESDFTYLIKIREFVKEMNVKYIQDEERKEKVLLWLNFILEGKDSND